MDKLILVPGISESIAKQLHLGKYPGINKKIKSIEELKKYSHLFKHETQIALEYLDFNNYLITKKEAKKFYSLFIKKLKILNPNFKNIENKFFITGSFRRGLTNAKDIDCIIDNRLILPVINTYLVWGELRKTILYKISSNKWILVDIFTYEKKNLPFALLHHTGGKEFNIAMRAFAKKQGYKLNQYGLWKGKKRINANSEKEIFEIIGKTYKEPKKRNY